MAEVKKTTAATVKADIAKTAAELAEGSKKTVEEVKKTATKAAETVKKATAKKAPAKKATATKKAAPAKKATTTKKAAPAKKATAAKKVEAKVSVNLQYGGLDVNIDEIIKKVKKAQKDCKKYEIYVKPEEGKAYYVADGQLGDVQL